jgi:vitamin B12 transport system substrate-binding protein
MIKHILLTVALILISTVQHVQATTSEKTLRIIALAPHIVENLYAIGAGDYIVGTVDYADYPKEAQSIERIGGHYGLSLEKIIALNPDFVLAWEGGNKAQDIAKIEQLGINVYLSNPTTLEGLADELIELGALTHHEEQSRHVAAAFIKELNMIKAEQQAKVAISVFYQLWPEPMMTAGGNTWINQLITLCKGDNVFSKASTDYPQISIENVVVAKPQVIIIPDEDALVTQPKIDWRKWPDIPAVKHAQFVSVNADLLHRFSPRMLGGLAQMCDQIDVSRHYYQNQVF